MCQHQQIQGVSPMLARMTKEVVMKKIAIVAWILPVVFLGCMAPLQQPPPSMYAMGGIGADGLAFSGGGFLTGSTCLFTWPPNLAYVVWNDSSPESRRFVAPADSSTWSVHPCDATRLFQGLVPPGGTTVRYVTRSSGRYVDTSLDGFTWFPGELAPRHDCTVSRSNDLPFQHEKSWQQSVAGHCQPLPGG